MDTQFRSLALGLLFAAACAGCATGAGPQGMKDTSTATPPRGQVANIMLVDRPDQAQAEKVILATFLFTAAAVQPKEAMVTFGPARTPRSEAGDYRLRLIDQQNRVLSEYAIWDPRKVVVERQGLVENPTGTYTAHFPMNARAKAVQVLDKQGNLVATAEIGSVIREFCRRTKQDRDCEDGEKNNR